MPMLAIPAIAAIGGGLAAKKLSKKTPDPKTTLSQTQQLTNQQMQQDMKMRQDMYNQILPFAQMLIKAGIDPIAFLQTPQGQALLGPVKESIGQEFDQARTNMFDWFSGSGVDPKASGLAMGPIANLFGSESKAQSDALRDFISNSMNMGLQGANILQGQQGVFNPGIAGGLSISAGNSLLNAPRPGWGLAQSLIGAGGQALGGYLQRT